MNIEKFTFNPFAENTYIVWDSASREAMVVDPGMYTSSDVEQIERFLSAHELRLKYIVNTHLHVDHAWGIAHLAQKHGLKPLAHPDDFFLGERLQQQAQMFGLDPSDIIETKDFESIGDRLTLGMGKIEVIHTPGHSPGGICLYCPAEGWILTGDTLFCGGIGRTDLPGGDYQTLLDSLNRLAELPGDTIIYPGHGPSCPLREA